MGNPEAASKAASVAADVAVKAAAAAQAAAKTAAKCAAKPASTSKPAPSKCAVGGRRTRRQANAVLETAFGSVAQVDLLTVLF